MDKTIKDSGDGPKKWRPNPIMPAIAKKAPRDATIFSPHPVSSRSMPSHACIPFIDQQGIERSPPKGKPIFAAVLRCAVKTRRRNGCRLDTAAAQKTIKTSIRLATHDWNI
jgi:hypothetical protein